MSAIWICPVSEVELQVRELSPSHLVSLMDPGSMIDTPHPLTPERHLRLECHDIGETMHGYAAPGVETARSLIEFADQWEQESPILIHCWAGVSRSTASAFIVACRHNPDRDETEIAQSLRAASPTAWPNLRLVHFADELIGRRGRMVAAIEEIGEGHLMRRPQAFELVWR